MQDVKSIAKDIKDLLCELEFKSWSSITVNVDFVDGLDEPADIDVSVNFSSPTKVEFYDPQERLIELMENLGRSLAEEQKAQGVLTEFEYTLKQDNEVALNVSFDRHNATD